jgi:hypothetical protein
MLSLLLIIVCWQKHGMGAKPALSFPQGVFCASQALHWNNTACQHTL